MAKLRNIVVDGRDFLWRVSEGGEPELRVWFAGFKAAPFRLTAQGWPGEDSPRFSTYASATIDDGVRLYNLHRPGVIAGLIRIARRRGWTQERALSLSPQLFGEAGHGLPPEPVHDPTLELATKLLEAAARPGHPAPWFRAQVGMPWRRLCPNPEHALFAITSLIELEFTLATPALLPDHRRDAAVVWADERLANGRSGGLAVASWLRHSYEARRSASADLHAWARELLAKLE